jgi:DNA-binding SARP family transcriptional activator
VRSALLRLPSLLVPIVALGALAALARFRPAFPETPASLSSPLTTAFLQELATVAAWLLAALVVLLLLVHSLRDIRASRNYDFDRTNLPAGMRELSLFRRPAGMPGLPRPLIDEPTLLVAAPREPPPTPPEEQSLVSASKSAAGAVAELDSRPLISVLGPLTIQGGKRSRRGLRARALELIAFLALRREGAQRDAILEALWPGEDPQRSRHRLYQAVRDARRLLGDGVASERDRYWIDRGEVRVDVDELEELLEQLDAGDGGGQARRLESALALFRAEPLLGCDYAWSDGQVRSLRGTYVELSKRVGRARLETGDARGALQIAERGLAVDSLDEEMWRLALEAEGALGLREAIEERYGRLRELLRDRLALEPAKETRGLYLRLLGQR